MKEYLRTIHKRSDAHKKRFALIVAASITLIIFLIWSFVSFNNAPTVADNNYTNSDNLAVVDTATLSDVNAVTPFQDMMAGVGSAIGALEQSFGQVQQAAQNVNLNEDYQNVRNDALNTNGQ